AAPIPGAPVASSRKLAPIAANSCPAPASPGTTQTAQAIRIFPAPPPAAPRPSPAQNPSRVAQSQSFWQKLPQIALFPASNSPKSSPPHSNVAPHTVTSNVHKHFAAADILSLPGVPQS